MILYVITHTREKYETERDKYRATRTLLEELAGDYGAVVHYTEVTPALLEALRPWAICHSGGTHGGAKEAAGWRWCVAEYEGAAQIGFCAGHQLAGQVFGGELAPMRPLAPGELDPWPDWSPGMYKERGVYRVAVDAPNDPLFAGLPPVLNVWQNHRYHLAALGPDLTPLASSPDCPYQAFRHRTRPIYGVQFHPEVPTEGHEDGMRLLANFFAMARERVTGSG